jgi:hypothetical protein
MSDEPKPDHSCEIRVHVTNEDCESVFELARICNLPNPADVINEALKHFRQFAYDAYEGKILRMPDEEGDLLPVSSPPLDHAFALGESERAAKAKKARRFTVVK